MKITIALIYPDTAGNIYVVEQCFMVRLSDGTRHDGTTVGNFYLVEEITVKDLVFSEAV